MKVKTNINNIFNPIELSITIETLDELKALRAISNISINNIKEHNTDFEHEVLENVLLGFYAVINDKYEELR